MKGQGHLHNANPEFKAKHTQIYISGTSVHTLFLIASSYGAAQKQRNTRYATSVAVYSISLVYVSSTHKKACPYINNTLCYNIITIYSEHLRGNISFENQTFLYGSTY